MLDLRSIAQRAVAETPSGLCLFVTPNAGNLSAEYDNLGTDPTQTWTQQNLNRWKSALNLPNTLTATNLRGVIWETLTLQSDPTGVDRAPPLVPSKTRYEVWLNGQLADSKPFALADPESTPLLDLLKRLYRRHRQASLDGLAPANHYKKVLGFWVRKYAIAYRNFQPSDLPDEEPIAPTTTITDNFNRTNADAMGTSSGGWSWTETEGDLDIVSNAAETQVSTENTARADSDLSSDDHYSQAVCSLVVVQGGGPGLTTRMASSGSPPNYYLLAEQSEQSRWAIYSRISGTYALLASGNTGYANSASTTFKLTSDGSSHEAFVGGVSKVGPVTDTGITGNLRCGLYAYNSGRVYDDFQGADLAAAAVVRHLCLLGVGA